MPTNTIFISEAFPFKKKNIVKSDEYYMLLYLHALIGSAIIKNLLKNFPCRQSHDIYEIYITLMFGMFR